MPVMVIILVFTTFIISYTGTHNAKEITIEQAGEIAQPYFLRLYGKDVTIIKVEHNIVGIINQNHLYLNFISVFDGNAEYELVLDENNEPLSDNVSAIEKMNNISIASLEKRITHLGLQLHKYYNLSTAFTYQDRRYTVNLAVIPTDIPEKDKEEDVFTLLTILKNEGIDNFIIVVNSPSFFPSTIGMKQVLYGTQLTAEYFVTDIDKGLFSQKYNDLTNRIYWDREKIVQKLDMLIGAGYDYAYFCVTPNYENNLLEIELYCESDNSITDEYALVLLGEMDESYFRVKDKEIKYTLRHIFV